MVVVLGHVDHGKTSILDKIRQTRVADKEAGGITQHIGAYQVELPPEAKSREASGDEGRNYRNRKITFLDTPGHEAFIAIRSRGAKVADVGVLVVAAEEGVKPQTKEAIQIIKQSELPFVVAINKIDKEGANPQRVRQELAEQEVLVEDYGGQVPVVEMSARTGQGIDHLLELILLVAELEELTATTDSPAKGAVIESHLDSRRGLVATLVVQVGELKIGDWVSAGSAIGRAKLLEDYTGKNIKIAVASQPCVMLGWELAPKVGQEFIAVTDRSEAEKLAAATTNLGPLNIFTLETSDANQIITKKIVNFIIKTDVQSSLEAIDQVLRTIKSDEVGYKVVSYGVGNVSDADIKNARATGAAVIGFHVRVDASAKQSADREKIRVETYDIVYQLVEGVRLIMSDWLEPEIKRIDLGKVKILALFASKSDSQIVGGRIIQGRAVRGAMIDVIRNNALLTTGRLGQLQQNKADMMEVGEGLELGIRFDPLVKSPPTIAVGDILEIYQEEKIKRTI